MSVRTEETPPPSPTPSTSTAAMALAAAGDAESARDVSALDDAAKQAALRLGKKQQGLVERLIYGPAPSIRELQSGAVASGKAQHRGQAAVEAAIACMARGEAFSADGKLSAELRAAVAKEKAYGFTVPAQFGEIGRAHV